MEKVALTVALREGLGKGHARRIRLGGGFPAVIYGRGDSTPITIDRKEFARILRSGGGGTTLLSVKFAGSAEGEKMAIVRDFQTDPLTNTLLHADLMEVAMDKAIHVMVPMTLSAGEIKGVKNGGYLQHPTREIMVECLPANIPEHIVINASDLDIGATLHVSDLDLPEGVKALEELDKVVVHIAAPMSAEKLDAMLSAEAA